MTGRCGTGRSERMVTVLMGPSADPLHTHLLTVAAAVSDRDDAERRSELVSAARAVAAESPERIFAAAVTTLGALLGVHAYAVGAHPTCYARVVQDDSDTWSALDPVARLVLRASSTALSAAHPMPVHGRGRCVPRRQVLDLSAAMPVLSDHAALLPQLVLAARLDRGLTSGAGPAGDIAAVRAGSSVTDRALVVAAVVDVLCRVVPASARQSRLRETADALRWGPAGGKNRTVRARR